MWVVLLISNDCFNRLRMFCSVLSAGFSCCLCLRFMREKFHGLCSHGLECPWCEPHFCFDPIPGMAFTYTSFKSLTLPCNYIAHIWSLEYGSCMWLTSSGQHVHAGARFHNQSILLHKIECFKMLWQTTEDQTKTRQYWAINNTAAKDISTCSAVVVLFTRTC